MDIRGYMHFLQDGEPCNASNGTEAFLAQQNFQVSSWPTQQELLELHEKSAQEAGHLFDHQTDFSNKGAVDPGADG
jgi:hypothetical protein